MSGPQVDSRERVEPCVQVELAAEAIRTAWPRTPRVGIILGTGLGALATEVEVDTVLEGAQIPHFPRSTAPTHRGALVCGRLADVPVMVFSGRVHGYEGAPVSQLAFSVQILAALGAELVILSNACGGMNPNYRTGDLVILEDQINLTWANPLIGSHDRGPLGYPDMSCPFDRALIEQALLLARRQNVMAHRGVYVGVLGPNYETRAEYRFFRRLGADAVGMSTVHEVLMARQLGLRVFALSVVSNECRPDALGHATSSGVEHAAASAEPNVRAIIRGIVEHVAAQA